MKGGLAGPGLGVVATLLESFDVPLEEFRRRAAAQLIGRPE